MTIKILLPINKTKTNKPIARGLWYDKNKIYYDYLQVIKTPKINKHLLNAYCKFYNQLAIFFIINNTGYLYSNKTNKIDYLPLNKTFTTAKPHKKLFKRLLKKYNGLTIFRHKIYLKSGYKIRYKISVYYKPTLNP